MAQTTTRPYMTCKEGADGEDVPEDAGVASEGVELLCKLRNTSLGCATLFGLIYTLNLSSPQELKFTFDFSQKVLAALGGNKLPPIVQTLKIKVLLSSQVAVPDS